MMMILLFLVAVLPGLLVCWLIYRSDKYEREDFPSLLLSFGLGMLVTVPGLMFQTWLNRIGWDDTTNIWWVIVVSFVFVALSEELLKFIALYFYPFRQRFFDEPMDGIVYAVMIGMGFATAENVMYAFKFGMGTTIVRALTAIPAHAVFAIMMGYYMGLAKFDRRNRNKLLLIGLLLAIGIHGLYDFFILQEAYEWLIVMATVTLFVSIYFAIRLVKLHQQNSPFNTFENQPTDDTDVIGS